MAAVEIAGGRLDGNVDVTEFLVAGQRGPRAGVAGVFPGIVFPRLDPLVARLRDGLERPDFFAGAHVVATNVAGDVFFRGRRGAGEERGAGHDDVADHHGGRTRADLAGLHDVAVE